jgi:cytosine/adenosine deaminase-related metal-dependent hydrolase
MLGREDEIGSLTSGKLADLVVIDADALNLFPVHDPAATVVMQTGLANIEAVMIGGVWKKRNGRLAFDNLETRKAELAQSGDRLIRAIEEQGRPAWR